jgi:arginase
VLDVVRLVGDKVATVLDGEGLPLIIGGDCTITLGVVAAFARQYPRLGLMYLDGDIDVSTPDSTISGILDAMGLAHLLGQGVPELVDAGPQQPMLSGDHVVAFGYDEIESTVEERAWLTAQGVDCHPANGMKNAREEAERAWAELAKRAGPILVHFDIDVIDSTDFPLANFPHFNEGLSYEDTITALRTFCSDGACGGLVLTGINPDRDPDGALVDRLLGDLVAALV